MTALLTVDEVADLLKVSKWQVYELAKERSRSGELRPSGLYHPYDLVVLCGSVW